MRFLHSTGPILALSLLITSCTWNTEEEPPPQEGTSFVPYTWVTNTTMHKIILRMVEEENGQIKSPDPMEDPKTGELDDEIGAALLVKVGMLTETDDSYTIASNSELEELPGHPDVTSAELASAMGSILARNEVRWCGEPQRGLDFRDNYLDIHNKFDEQTYDTREEYWQSIEDYVECGTG